MNEREMEAELELPSKKSSPDDCICESYQFNKK